MKIPESPYHFTGNQPIGAGLPLSREQMFDAVDLKFLEMLTGMNRAAAQKVLQGQVEVSAQEPEPLEKPARSSSAVPLSVNTKMDEARVELAKLYDELTQINVKKELEMLQGRLSADDVQFLQQIVIAGLPYQGGVPVGQILTVGGQGRPTFEGLGISTGLSDLLEKAWKSGRSLRVDMDAQSSVILRFHQGKVSAEFLTQDQGMALLLKQAMDDLRQRLETKNLPVGTLSARSGSDSRHEGREESGSQDNSQTEG